MQPGVLASHLDVIESQAKKLDGITSIWAEGGCWRWPLTRRPRPNSGPRPPGPVEAVGTTSLAAPRFSRRSFYRRSQLRRQVPLGRPRSGARSGRCRQSHRPRLAVGQATAIVRPASANPQARTVLAEIMNHPGEAARGEQLFTRLNCGKCHTVNRARLCVGPSAASGQDL